MKTCKSCHQSKTLSEFPKHPKTKDGFQAKCKECTSEYQKQWYLRNRERVLISQAQYAEANKDKCTAKARNWRQANPEAAKAAQARYRSTDAYKAKHSAQMTLWAKQNPEKVRARMAERRGVPYTREGKDYIPIVLLDPCVYCGGASETIDHIQPIAKGGSGDWDNLAPSCKSCNSSKGPKSLLEFLRYRLTL